MCNTAYEHVYVCSILYTFTDYKNTLHKMCRTLLIVEFYLTPLPYKNICFTKLPV